MNYYKLLDLFAREDFFNQKDNIEDLLKCSEKIDDQKILDKNLHQIVTIQNYVIKEYEINLYSNYRSKIDDLRARIK